MRFILSRYFSLFGYKIWIHQFQVFFIAFLPPSWKELKIPTNYVNVIVPFKSNVIIFKVGIFFSFSIKKIMGIIYNRFEILIFNYSNKFQFFIRRIEKGTNKNLSTNLDSKKKILRKVNVFMLNLNHKFGDFFNNPMPPTNHLKNE